VLPAQAQTNLLQVLMTDDLKHEAANKKKKKPKKKKKQKEVETKITKRKKKKN